MDAFYIKKNKDEEISPPELATSLYNLSLNYRPIISNKSLILAACQLPSYRLSAGKQRLYKPRLQNYLR